MTLFKIKLSDLEYSENNVNKAIDKITWTPIEKWIKDNYRVDNLTYVYDDKKDIYKVSSKGDVNVKNKNIKYLTNDYFEWDEIKKDFSCSYCNALTTLKGAPKKIGGDFYCYNCNSLTSLEGAPQEVKGSFKCSRCYQLTSLEGAPRKIGGDFYCSDCVSLKTLEGSPEEVGNSFYCYNCNSLISLKGSPKIIQGNFRCENCRSLLSLEGAPQEVNGYFDCCNCESLTSLEGLNVIKEFIHCSRCHKLKNFAGFINIVI